jgi:hypothetical protein
LLCQVDKSSAGLKICGRGRFVLSQKFANSIGCGGFFFGGWGRHTSNIIFSSLALFPHALDSDWLIPSVWTNVSVYSISNNSWSMLPRNPASQVLSAAPTAYQYFSNGDYVYAFSSAQTSESGAISFGVYTKKRYVQISPSVC